MGTPSPGWDSLVLEAQAPSARRRRRRRLQRADALAADRRHDGGAGGHRRVRHAHLQGPDGGRPAALSASARTVSHATASGAAHQVKPARHHRHDGDVPAGDRRLVRPVLPAARLALAAGLPVGPEHLAVRLDGGREHRGRARQHRRVRHRLARPGLLGPAPAAVRLRRPGRPGADRDEPGRRARPGLLRRGAAFPHDREELRDTGQRAPGLDGRVRHELPRRREPGPDLEQRTGRRGGRGPWRRPVPRRVLRLGARQPRHPEGRHVPPLAAG